MKDLNEYTAEVHRRVELECRTRKQLRAGVLAFCVPLVICVLAGALTLPRLLEKKGLGGTDGAELERRTAASACWPAASMSRTESFPIRKGRRMTGR